MSDRSDFYYEQNVTQAELDQAFDDVENADRNLIADQTVTASGGEHAVWGVMNGLTVSQTGTPSLSVEIADGVAYDYLGRRIPHSGGPYTLDLTSLQPGSDQRYVRIYAEFTRDLSDPRTDGLGSAIDYRQEEGVVFSADAGAISASPVKPAIVAGKVLLATVLMVNGLLVQDARISMGLPSIADPAGDRQEGGLVAAHGRLTSPFRKILYDSGSEIVVDLNGNSLQTRGGSIYLDNPGDLGGGDIYMEKGGIIHASEVQAEQPNPTSGRGFLYVDVSTGALTAVNKYATYDATHFTPIAHITQEQVYDSTAVNSWYLESDAGGPFPWDEHVARWCHVMSSAGANYSQGLACALVGLPNLSQLVQVSFGVEIFTVVDANMKFGVAVFRRRNLATAGSDLINDGGAITWWEAPGVGMYQYNSGTLDAAKDRIDAQTYSYYACFFAYSTVARASVDIGLKVCQCIVSYQIREASGIY